MEWHVKVKKPQSRFGAQRKNLGFSFLVHASVLPPCTQLRSFTRVRTEHRSVFSSAGPFAVRIVPDNDGWDADAPVQRADHQGAERRETRFSDGAEGFSSLASLTSLGRRAAHLINETTSDGAAGFASLASSAQPGGTPPH